MRPPASRKNARPKSKSVRHIDTLLRQKRYPEALEAVAPLAKQFPEHPDVAMQHGCALAWTSHFEEAEPLLLKALKNYPSKTSLLTLLSRCYFETERYFDAVRVLTQAFEQEPEYLDALYMLGRVKAEQGDHREAEDAFRRALAKAPNSGSLHYSFALYHHYLPNDTIFETLPTAVKEQPHSYFERALGHFALGKAYLDIEQHEKAFQWLEQGNALVVQEGKVLDKHFNVKYQLSQLVKGVKKEGVERATNPEPLAFPHIVIVGASRSGKSLVESLLTAGTDIAPLGESTVLVDYVNDILKAYDGDVVNYVQAAAPATCRQHAEGYLALRDGKPLSTLTLPEHINFLGVLALWFPNLPLVFCRRDLHDVAISQYFSYYGKGNAHSYDLHHLGEYLAYYERLMRHWEKVLPNPIVPVSYDALTHETETTTTALFNALGMTPASAASAKVDENTFVPRHPVRSLDVPMPLSQAFNGIAQPFLHHLTPMESAYKGVMRMPIVSSMRVHAPKPPVFRWQLEGGITLMDQGGMLLPLIYAMAPESRQALSVIAFDPANVAQRLVEENGADDMYYFPNTTLGNGTPMALHHCLEAQQSALLEPLDRVNASGAPKVLVSVAVPSIALDSIEGIDSIEALALGVHHDIETIFAHGQQRLQGLLVLQVRLCTQPRYQGQLDMASINDMAAAFGLRFYRFLHPVNQAASAEVSQLTQLETIDALFVPDDDKLQQLSDAQRTKLAFLLDNVWGIHDLAHSVLSHVDAAQAARYAQVHGATPQPQAQTAPAEAAVSPLHEARRALAEHSIHRAIEITGKLVKQPPQDAQVIGLHGYCVMQLGYIEKSLPWLFKACELDPTSFEAHRWLFDSLLRNGKRQEARRVVKHMQQRISDVPETWAKSAVVRLTLAKETASKSALKEALKQCEAALVVHPDHPQFLHLSAKANARLSHYENALALYAQAITALNGRNVALQTEWLIERAGVHEEMKEVDSACADTAEAFSLRPYSFHTKEAYHHFVRWLPKSQTEALHGLAPLHHTIRMIWEGYQDEALTHVFGDYGLPYQAFEPLQLPGSRPSMARLSTYQLARYLPENARALDIGCNHGYLLLGLAPHLAYGYGFDISQACVDVGNAVADHLEIHHVELKRQELDDFVCDEPFDLVIACAVHRWIGMPIEAFGEALHRFCRPGGIVLLESQGVRSTQHTEPDFAAKAERIASVGFTVVEKGSLCDDKLNYREYWLLQRD